MRGSWSPAVPGAVTEPGLVIYSFGAALFYANASLFAKEIRGLVGPAPSPVRWLVVDAEAITNVDYTAARMVRQLHEELVRPRSCVGVRSRAPLSEGRLGPASLDPGHRPGAVFRPPSRCGGCIRETQRPTSTNGVRESISIRLDLASNVLRAEYPLVRSSLGNKIWKYQRANEDGGPSNCRP